MTTLPLHQLVAGLRAQAEGAFGAEAAAELLIAHDVWLRRQDFLDHLVDQEVRVRWDHTSERWEEPIVWVDWPAAPRFLDRRACSSSEEKILRLAAELVNVDSGVPLGHLLTGLDDRNARLVADAIDHVLTRGGGRR